MATFFLKLKHFKEKLIAEKSENQGWEKTFSVALVNTVGDWDSSVVTDALLLTSDTTRWVVVWSVLSQLLIL